MHARVPTVFFCSPALARPEGAVPGNPVGGAHLLSRHRLEHAASLGLQFLEDILYSDGNIPLFNDSAFGIAPRPADLLAYGTSVVNWSSTNFGVWKKR